VQAQPLSIPPPEHFQSQIRKEGSSPLSDILSTNEASPLEFTPTPNEGYHPQQGHCGTEPQVSNFAAEDGNTAANIPHGKGGYKQYRRELMRHLTDMYEQHPVYFNPLGLSLVEYQRMFSRDPVHSLHATLGTMQALLLKRGYRADGLS
jgi:hypothetical protein